MAVSALEAMIPTLEAAVRDLEPATLTAEGARHLVEVATRGERLFGALKTLAARRVAESNAWRGAGDRSPAHWLARQSGVSVGQAVATLETAARLEELPAVDVAVRAGELSSVQANEIASAAAANPDSVSELLQTAAREGMQALRERCGQVKAAARHDEVAHHEAIRRRRYLRHFTDHDGAFRLEGRLTVEAGATLLTALEPHQARVFAEARRAGRREPYDAYRADALIELARSAGIGTDDAGPRASLHLRVDHAAWVRGHLEAGEVSEVPGVGPIPVASARALASDAIISAIVCDGVDVTAVAHLGRTIPAHLRTALIARDPVCVVPGCHTRDGLEIDHIRAFAEGGPTCLDNLCRLCRWHHYLKTHQGYRLTGGPSDWGWEPPESHAHSPPGGLDLDDDTGTIEERRGRIYAAALARALREYGPAP